MTPDGRTETVMARISPHDLERLDRMVAHRGVDRATLVATAIDALLAQEAWSGGFIPAPPAARVPPPIDARGGVRRSWRFGRRPRTN